MAMIWIHHDCGVTLNGKQKLTLITGKSCISIMNVLFVGCMLRMSLLYVRRYEGTLVLRVHKLNSWRGSYWIRKQLLFLKRWVLTSCVRERKIYETNHIRSSANNAGICQT